MNTILFSNIVGNIFDEKSEMNFLPQMEKVLSSWKMDGKRLVYIDAPMCGYDNLVVFKNVKKCFKNIAKFNEIVYIGKETDAKSFDLKDAVFFLTGGDPLVQKKIIKNNNLENAIKNAEFCIGFCAGAMNLSKYGIVTSDEDFDTPQVYQALGRVEISVEPHFNYKEQKGKDPKGYEKRLAELDSFVEQIKKPIYAVPDTSFICFNKDKMTFFGEIVVFE